MDLNKLKQANQIYESLADKTIDEAMHQLNTFDNLDKEVLSLVKSLISNSQQPSAYFDQKVSQHYQTMLSKSWQVGDQIGGYELLSLIGQGGMSMVYKAQRIDSETQKPVAIKLFNLPNQSTELKARFQAEQNILAELSHPNVIDFYHGENADQGDAYIVMELIDGGLSIDEFVQTQQLNTKQIVALLIQAAQALQYAHNHLIIHRDVKPSNLMVTTSGQLKVLDFGIAKLIKPQGVGLNSSSSESQVQDTIMALTPSFASPEQINAQSIDITTDVFSLAAVAVYLLTGQQPFPANRMLKSCADDEAHLRKLLKTHIQDHDLRNILTQALQQNSKHRYANMYALSEDLSAWLAQKPVSASNDSWWYRLNRFAHRRTALFTTSLVLCATVMAAIIALSVQNQAIKFEAEKAAAVKNFMLDAFSVTDPNYSQGTDISSKDLLRLSAEKITVANNMDEDIKIELLLALAMANGRLGFYPEAIALLNDAAQLQPENEQVTALLAQYLFNAGEIETVNTLLLLTNENSFNSKTDRAAIIRIRALALAQASEYDQAFALIKSLKLIDGGNPLLDQPVLAEIHYLKGESNKSIAIINQLKSDHPLAATDVTNLALNSDLVQYHDQMGNYNAAMTLTQENITAFKKILGDQHPDLGLAYNALSVFQRLDGKLDEALASAKISEQIYRQRYGDSSEGLAQALGNIGVTLYYQQEPIPATHNLTAAADMLSSIFGEDHPETMTAKANLATILNAVGFPEQALPILQQIHQFESQTIGETHRSALYTQMSLALTLANLDQFDSAIAHAKQSIQLITENYPNRADFINHSHSVLGRVYYMAAEHELAIEQNLIHIDNWTEGNENNYARSLQLIAGSYFALKSFDQANQFAQKWTMHLAKIYGESDIKHLQGLLDWAEKLENNDQSDPAKKIALQAQELINKHDLDYPDIQKRIQKLNK